MPAPGWPGPWADPGWYISRGTAPGRPAGTVARWWTGSAWGPDVALADDDGLLPPPGCRQRAPHAPATVRIVVPMTRRLPRPRPAS